MTIAKNTYIGGIDQDTSPHKTKATTYYMLKDGHVITDGGMTTEAIENEKGTILALEIPNTQNSYKLSIPATGRGGMFSGYIQIITAFDSSLHFFSTGTSFDDIYNSILSYYAPEISANKFAIYKNNYDIWFIGLDEMLTVLSPIAPNNHWTLLLTTPAQTGLMIIGTATMRDEIIVYTTNSDLDTPGKNGQLESYGQIWKFTFNELTNDIIGISSNKMLVPSQHLCYNNKLNFSTFNRVKQTITRYENPEYAKIYFTDGYNNFRHLNINDPNKFILDPSLLETLSDTIMSEPVIIKINSSGGLLSGSVQYAYQLYNKVSGTETVISPASKIAHLSSKNDTDYLAITKDYWGDIAGQNTGKSATIYISGIDTKYTNLKLYRLFYGDIAVMPTITLISDLSVTSSGTALYTDNGSAGMETLTDGEFTALGSTLFVCQSLETKNNKLFAANLIEESADIDFDARCFRYDKNNKTYTVDNKPNVELDDVNPYNDINNDGIKANRFIFQKGHNSIGDRIIGGTGIDQYGLGVPNISYKFVNKQIEGITNDNAHKMHTVYDPLVYNQYTWGNHADPIFDGRYRSYMRDEIYSFAIVFFDLKARPYFAKWIADIRMPAMADTDDYSHYRTSSVAAGTNGYKCHALGVEFTVNIPDSLLNKISGFKIVRCERKQSDSTILAQGLLSLPLYSARNETAGTYQMPLINPIAAYPSDPPALQYMNTIMFNKIWLTNMHILSYENNHKRFRFYSPEVQFNKNINSIASDYFRLEGIAIGEDYNNTSYSNLAHHAESTRNAILSLASHIEETLGKEHFVTKMQEVTNSLFSGAKIDWDSMFNGLKVNIESSEIGVNDTYEQYDTSDSTPVFHTAFYYPGSAMYGNLSYNGNIFSDLYSSTNRYKCEYALVNYKRSNSSQYGGNTKSDRYNREYIDCGDFVPVSSMTQNTGYKSATTEVYGGDTFVSWFDYFRGSNPLVVKQGTGPKDAWLDADIDYIGTLYPPAAAITDHDNDLFPVVIYFPVETSINLALRHDPCFSRHYHCFLREDTNPGTDFDKWDNSGLYKYNSAYSRNPNLNKYFPKPQNYQNISSYDVRIRNTEIKYTNSLIDTWANFKPNDFNEVDTTFGAITRIIHHENMMHVIQSGGHAILSIDERVSTLDSTGATLVLGTGDTIGKYGYISNISGSIHHDSVLSAQSGLHYFDVRNRKWMMYNSKNDLPLNSIKGLHAYFLNNLNGNILTRDKPIQLGLAPVGIIAAYNYKYRRVIMTFLNFYGSPKVYEKHTITYNEFMDAFEKTNVYYPSLYTYSRDRLLSVLSRGNKMYIHDEGDYGVYYDNPPVPLELTIVVNDSEIINKIFTNIEFNSQVLLNGLDQFNETIDRIEIWTSHQNTGNIILVPEDNIKRRKRTWRLQIARDNDPSATNFDPLRKSDARISDRYMFVKVTFTNNNNKRFILHDIMTTFIVQHE